MAYRRPLIRCPIMKVHGYQYFKNDTSKCKHCGQIFDIKENKEQSK